ncbi:class C sortase [Nanchangia anserum]|uniref:class C sortase n=1 Tax=Nanchangia anserum TaxID=2692125 RepID=UPI0030B84DD7
MRLHLRRSAKRPASTDTADAADEAAKPTKRRRLRRPWRWPWSTFIAVVLVLLGVTSMLYPTAASWVDQYNQSHLIAGYEHEVDTADPSAAEQLAMAHRYNESLTFGAELKANERLPYGYGTSSDAQLTYDNLLKTTPSGMMARLIIPSIDVDLPVYHGTSDATLLKGLGHLEGTSLPVGGKSTHAVITGHRGLAEATMFTNLNKVKVGDTIRIEIFGEALTYQVRSSVVVEPDEREKLKIVPGKDLLTLVTCTPLGINTHRILVTAERIPNPEPDPGVGRASEVPRFPWWIVVYAGALILGVVVVWRSGYTAAKTHQRKLEAAKTSAEKDDEPEKAADTVAAADTDGVDAMTTAPEPATDEQGHDGGGALAQPWEFDPWDGAPDTDSRRE